MRVVFMGTGAIGLPALRWLLESGHEVAAVFTQPDKPAGRSMELQAPPVKLLAAERGVAVFQPAKIRAAEAVEEIRGLKPDLILVMAYGQILPSAVLEAPRIACINLHASILPRHRGAAPIQAALLAGDAETGITVMYMDAGLDTGDILLIRRFPVHRHETAGTLHDRLAELAPAALEEAVGLLEAGRAPRIPQDGALATHAGKLEREDGRIRWEAGAPRAGRQVRAMNPWPGAFTVLPGRRKLKVFEAAENGRRDGAPSEVLESGPRGILVGCGSGSLLLREVQLEGKRRMRAWEFLAGHAVAPGMMLGAESE